MLKSIAYMEKEMDIRFFYDFNKALAKLRYYFCKFGKADYEEIIQITLFHAMRCFDPNKGSLDVYLKNLARDFPKSSRKKGEVLVDFLENTVPDTVYCTDDEDVGTVGYNKKRAQDFSFDVVESMDRLIDRSPEVVKIALECMDKFLLLCESIMAKDTNTKYYPKPFIDSCLKLVRKYPKFNDTCLEIYMQYGSEMQKFLDLELLVNPNWKEADFLTITNSISKRVSLINKTTGVEVEDADTEPYILKGNLGSGDKRKKIIKINYFDLWDYFCDKIDSTVSNELKFVIGNYYVVRTFGGSLSTLNADLYNEYDIIRMEIVTNLVRDTFGRIVNVGSENLYLLCNSDMNKTEFILDVYGLVFVLPYEDITDSLV